MLKFVTLKRETPATREVEARKKDFREISPPLAPEQLNAQSTRCSQCGVPFCQSGCPLHNNIPDWLALAGEGRLREAFETSSATSNMPEICGRICPQDRLCEKSCVLEQSDHGAVTIGAIEKDITDLAWQNDWVPPITVGPARAESIGIIGSGPAGLTAAEELRIRGYEVVVYEKQDRSGGLLTYGIPNFKLEKQIVERRIQRLREAGIQFQNGVAIGEDIAFASLRRKHQSLLIATGVYKSRNLNFAYEGCENVIEAMDYLVTSNRKDFGDRVTDFDNGKLDAQGKRVLVIGGGDTAMDCVRTAVRQGASQVSCLYRRDRKNMPGSQREVSYAEAEGVHFEWLSQPVGFSQKKGEVSSVTAVRMSLGAMDEAGRRVPNVISGSEYEIPVDMVILALGFDPEDLPAMFGCPELKVTSHGTLRVNSRGETQVPGVFAAGDIVRGASLVVWAIHDGRKVSQSIHQYLTANRHEIRTTL